MTPKTPTENEEERSLNDPTGGLSISFTDDGRTFKETGFWAVFDGTGSDSRSKILNDYFEFRESRAKQLKENQLFEIERFRQKIADATAKVETLNRSLEEHGNVDLLVAALKELRTELSGLENTLVEAYGKLGNAKSKLIEEQIDAAFKNLDQITSRYREIDQSFGDHSKKHASEQGAVLAIKPEFLSRLRDQYQEVHDQIGDRLKSLNLNGVSYLLRPQLLGYAAALASGWFFSVFALSKNLGNQDKTFFLLNGLFNFGDVLKGEVLYISMLQHVSFVVVSLIAVFGTSWLCHKWLERVQKREAFTNFFFNIFGGSGAGAAAIGGTPLDDTEDERRDEPSTVAQVSSRAFLTFWIQTIPIGVILGIGFIVLSLGNITPEDLNKLNTSISAQVVGIMVALAFGSLTYVYIVNVLEPRLEQRRKEDLPVNWLKSNLELAAIIVFFVGALMVLLFGIENTLYTFSSGIFSFLMFIGCVLMASFSIGYGIYYSGLIDSVNVLEAKIGELSIGAAVSSFPSIRLTLKADQMFRTAYIELSRKLFQLLDKKTRLAQRFYSPDQSEVRRPVRRHSRRDERNANRFLDWFRNLFGSGNSTVPSESPEEQYEAAIDELDDRFVTYVEDKEYFPELTCEIENLRGRLEADIKRVLEIEREIRDRREVRSPFAIQTKDELRELQDRIYNWEKHISQLLQKHLQESENLFYKQFKEFGELSDGMNLGRWFVASGITPDGDGGRTYD